jgi:hypothetical protein
MLPRFQSKGKLVMAYNEHLGTGLYAGNLHSFRARVRQGSGQGPCLPYNHAAKVKILGTYFQLCCEGGGGNGKSHEDDYTIKQATRSQSGEPHKVGSMQGFCKTGKISEVHPVNPAVSGAETTDNLLNRRSSCGFPRVLKNYRGA